MLNRIRLIIILAIALVFIAGSFYCLHRTWVSYKEAETFGTVSAVTGALVAELRNGGSCFVAEKASPDGESYQLNEVEYDELIIDLAKHHSLDPPPGWDKKGPLFDFWGNRFIISLRKVNDGWEIRVLSKGRDGLIGTADDIVREGRLAPNL